MFDPQDARYLKTIENMKRMYDGKRYSDIPAREQALLLSSAALFEAPFEVYCDEVGIIYQ